MTRTVDQWLNQYGLGKYAEMFAENEIGLDVVAQLTEEHLKELQVSLGDRLRLIKAIEAFETSSTEKSEALPSPDPAAYATAHDVEAERRQLTIMFCDLVGSTALSTRLDPEDLQEVIRGFHDVCAKVVAEHNGYVAKYMGDGVLIYFGYPQAHGNEAERAAHAGLGIVEAVAELGASQTKLGDAELAVRIGIDTGQVVVGDIVGEGASEEASVVGETPNIAARLQALADPNQVVIGPLTHQLIGDTFAYDDLGEHHLKGIAEPVHAWCVLRESDLEYEADEGSVDGGMPLVGRQEELGLLLRSWEASKDGHGQGVLIQGEAGIGKSRLVAALREQVSSEDYLWVAIRCSPFHANSALYPVIQHMTRVMGWKPEDDAATKLEKLEAVLANQSLRLEEAVPLYAELLMLPLPEERYAPLELSPKQKREQTLDALAGWLFEEAERIPVLQLWEDLHWADPTTLELLDIYIEQSPTVAMLNVLTYRPDFVPSGTTRSHVTPITLNRLERPEVEAIIAHQADGKTVPAEVVEHIVSKADGVPLYVEELTRTILESDYLREESDRYTLTRSLSDVSIPATLQDTLMARLDRLPQVRELAQLGAVLGREFAYEMLEALAEVAEPNLREGLGQLVDAELLYQRGRAPRAKYIFKHALIQDAAYNSLLKRTRQQYHQRVAGLLEEQFSAEGEAHPELAAHHYTEAGNAERAVYFWRVAGERARARSANMEAIAYLTKGIEMLQELPDDEERQHVELALQVSLGHANIVAKGHGAAGAETAYARALALCGQLGNVPELAPTLFGLWRFYVVARPLDETLDVADRLRRLAKEKQDTELDVVAHYALGYTTLCMGRLPEARENLGHGITGYLPSQRSVDIYRIAQDPGVACRAYLGMTEWLAGYPERARGLIDESVSLAEEVEDAFSLAYGLCFPGAIVAEESGGDTKELVERGLDIAKNGGFALWVAFGEIHRSFGRFLDQGSDAALDELRKRVVTVPRMGVHINTPYFMTILARACQRLGKADEGLKILDDASQSIDARGERWWEAEVSRLRGEFLYARSPEHVDDAQGCFEQALATARNQQARSLELRSAMSLARLWQQHDKRNDARQLLGDCYAWFTEGFDTPDLKDAKALLDTFS